MEGGIIFNARSNCLTRTATMTRSMTTRTMTKKTTNDKDNNDSLTMMTQMMITIMATIQCHGRTVIAKTAKQNKYQQAMRGRGW